MNRRERDRRRGRLHLKRVWTLIYRGSTRSIFFLRGEAGESPDVAATSSLASPPRRLRLLLVLHTFANRDVPLRGGRIELSAAVIALDVIAGIAGRRWRQIVHIFTRRQSCLRVSRVADRVDEVLVFAPPIRFGYRLLRLRLKTYKRVSAFVFLGDIEIVEFRSFAK